MISQWSELLGTNTNKVFLAKLGCHTQMIFCLVFHEYINMSLKVLLDAIFGLLF